MSKYFVIYVEDFYANDNQDMIEILGFCKDVKFKGFLHEQILNLYGCGYTLFDTMCLTSQVLIENFDTVPTECVDSLEKWWTDAIEYLYHNGDYRTIFFVDLWSGQKCKLYFEPIYEYTK